MIPFLDELKIRNESLYYFGLICLVFALVFLLLTKISNIQVAGVNAWFKPFKFSASTVFYAWAMAWFCYYIPNFSIKPFNWAVIILLGFEIAYIAFQAGRGQKSHFNMSTPVYATLYSLMALAATAVTLYTAYVAVLFFVQPLPQLPAAYLWGIRFGLILFVIFSFEGFVMGSRLSHTIGGADGGVGIPILNWSTKFGDPRIANFIGMHALQIIPLLSYYLFKDMRAVFVLSFLYLLLATFTLVQALNGKPFIKSSSSPTVQKS